MAWGVFDWLFNISGDASGAVGALDKVETKVEKSTEKIKSKMLETKNRTKEAEMANEAFARSFDRLASASIGLSTSYISYQNTLTATADAQLRYQNTVEAYGEGSREAAIAMDRAERAAGANQAAFLSLTMQAFNMGKAIRDITSTMGPAIKAAIDSGNSFKFLGSSIGVALSAAGFLAAVFFALNSESDELRNTFTAIAVVLAALTAAQWAYNTAASFGAALSGRWAAVAVAATVAAGVALAGINYMQKMRDDAKAQAEMMEELTVVSETMATYESGDINVSVNLLNAKVDYSTAPEIARIVADEVEQQLVSRCERRGP